jgi:hypothetical protein
MAAGGGCAASAIGRTRWRQQQQLGGAASRGEHAAAVRAWRRWRGRPARGALERETCGSHCGAGRGASRGDV